MTRAFCILLSLQLPSPKKQEPNGREPPPGPCLGCGPALFCFHYHTLLCNLHKYRVIFYRVAQKIERKKKKTRSLCCVQRGARCPLIMAKDLADEEGSRRHGQRSGNHRQERAQDRQKEEFPDSCRALGLVAPDVRDTFCLLCGDMVEPCASREEKRPPRSNPSPRAHTFLSWGWNDRTAHPRWRGHAGH